MGLSQKTKKAAPAEELSPAKSVLAEMLHRATKNNYIIYSSILQRKSNKEEIKNFAEMISHLGAREQSSTRCGSEQSRLVRYLAYSIALFFVKVNTQTKKVKKRK